MLPHPCANGSTISRRRGRRISISCWADSLPSGWLFRLSVSEHGSDFVLKGALLFLLWSDHPYRPARDVDWLGYGESSVGALEAIFRKVCRVQVVEDGLVFAADSVQGASIPEDQE